MKTTVKTMDYRCNNCSARKSEELYALADPLFCPGDGDAFAIVRCSNCRLVYMNPRPVVEELARLRDAAPPDYFERWLESRWSKPARPADGFDSGVTPSLERILSYAKGPELKVLHIDCGKGFTLSGFRSVRTHTVRTFGTERRAELGTIARQAGHDVTEGEFADLDLPASSFDLVWSSNNISLMHDPTAFANRVWELLKPAGIFWIRTANHESLDARLSGARWGGFDGARRWFFYSPATIEYLALKAGFEPVTVTFVASPWHHLGWLADSRRLLADQPEPNTILLPLCWLADRLQLAITGRTSTMDAVLHKPDIPGVDTERQSAAGSL